MYTFCVLPMAETETIGGGSFECVCCCCGNTLAIGGKMAFVWFDAPETVETRLTLARTICDADALLTDVFAARDVIVNGTTVDDCC